MFFFFKNPINPNKVGNSIEKKIINSSHDIDSGQVQDVSTIGNSSCKANFETV